MSTTVVMLMMTCPGNKETDGNERYPKRIKLYFQLTWITAINCVISVGCEWEKVI